MNFPPPSAKQAKIIWLAVTGLAIAVLIGLVAALFWGMGRVLNILGPVLWPLAIAGVLAYLLDPVVDFLERKGLSRAKSILVVFGIALLVVAAVFGSIMPQVVRETRVLISNVPEYARNVRTNVERWIDHPPPWVQRFVGDQTTPEPQPHTLPPEAPQVDQTTTNAMFVPEEGPRPGGKAWDKERLQSATEAVAKAVPRIGTWLFGQVGRVAAWFGILVGLTLVPVYAFYLLLEKRGIESKWTDYLPVSDSSFKNELVFVLRSINGYLIAFFRGQVLVAICDSILYTIGFLAIGLPYAVLLGFVAVFLTLIPFLGAIVLCVTAVIIAAVQFGDWLHPLLVLVVFGIVQTLEGLVISPKIIGDRVGLHPLTIIIAVMIGTTLFGGLLGGILAIPMTAVLRVVLSRYIWKRRESVQAGISV